MPLFGSPTNAQQLATIRANQTQIIIPALANLATAIAVLGTKLAVLDKKLDAIIYEVTPAESGNFNPETATISQGSHKT